MAEILDVSEESFAADVLQSDQPVLIDFWAEWCAPCRRLSPVIAELASEYDGRLRVAKVDADANPELAARYQVRALPTVLFIKGGEVSGQLVGNQSKDTLKQNIEQVLSS